MMRILFCCVLASLFFVSYTNALTLSTRETSPTPNESQVRLFIQDDSTLSINEPFKAYYYIKGSNLQVVDNYTPYCELSVEEITDSISRVVLDYTKSYNQVKDKEVIPHTTGMMFSIYSQDNAWDRTQSPSYTEGEFFKINENVDIVNEVGEVLYGDPDRINSFVHINISPNPVDDVMNITYSGDAATYSFEIVSNTTQTCVKSWTTSFHSSTEDNEQIETIPLSGLASTSYTLFVKRGTVVLKKILFYKG